MKAAVWYDAKDIRVEERSEPSIHNDEVKVRVAWAGICGSDLHEYEEGPVFIPNEEQDPISGGQAPFAMGHEFSGVVEAIGENVKDVHVGDRVSINPVLTYGNKGEHYDIYDGVAFIGLHREGGFADFVSVPEDHVYKLPEGLSLELGALVEPTSVAVQSIKESNITIGETVAVFGVGPIGLLTVIAARAAGASKIIALDLSETRLQKAKDVGATHIINSGEEDAVEAVKQIVPDGVDKSFEVAGIGVTFNQAVAATKARGIMNVVSIFANDMTFHPMSLTTTGVSVKSTFAFEPSTYKQTLELLANGQLYVDPVITDHIDLNDIVPRGFEALSQDKSQAKILVRVSGKS
ncbi:butanediol dehydrogenase [Marinococcus halophilus]|uniref:2,3-butanediol dehydrogenase n=1 Tax=Marinococcus halophilus TaxID=1371 RepID=A0A510Y8V8_MARHA|nr:2,3-butanediol dehydrogenase [Marinococcus halophilus]OZT79159.1 butanediol dehydrogenase [Marinococcus halophilus]GEK59818.1 2,3-butanediol dehydrogenase [Marinococcus halophilus]